ncbi:simple sugar transport system substrate-binding protein [Microbacterium halimionae]|uniref:Simple sugar transport system substrate-binding protein n=1 Tax=Microbacterium halimionae TaxID=1526413 RepID=A0A7W3JLI5_9MICO|nr:substrate-binding domain-containing protein [Microbacterium halimionae]MBA8815117.1 simple sugar transport system substrate-binding protein [Microbacterium halimionae]NII94092.1 simple sugar transport system substrate-binding protein [Microbacterium halimionae]
MTSRLTARRWLGFGAAAAAAALVLTGCAQQTTSTDAASATTVPVADLHEPFNGDPVEVALVQQSGAGDYFTAWTAGANAQAAAINIDLTVTDARNDNAKQASDLEQAIASNPDAIIIDHGQTDTLEPRIRDAVDAGIPVIVYDLALEDTDGVIVTSQSDASMASGVLDQLIADVGEGANVGLVSAEGFAPLDRRKAVWDEYVTDNDLNEQFFVGEVTESTATDNIPLVDAALKQYPDTQAIFAPYDEITKGVVQAVIQNNLQDSVKVYGIDISNADIEVMIADGSPWVATSATDPAAIGAAVVRALALSLAGELDETDVQFPAITVTQDFLLENDITNVSQLRDAEPSLLLDDVVVADWLPAVSS